MTAAPAFGELLRRARVAAGFTQEVLAERAGLSSDAVSALERGARQSPQEETLRLLLEALDPGEDERDRLVAASRRPDGRSGLTTRALASDLLASGEALPAGPAHTVYIAAAPADLAAAQRLAADLSAQDIVALSVSAGLRPGSVRRGHRPTHLAHPWWATHCDWPTSIGAPYTHSG